jgi:hypothetical protein
MPPASTAKTRGTRPTRGRGQGRGASNGIRTTRSTTVARPDTISQFVSGCAEFTNVRGSMTGAPRARGAGRRTVTQPSEYIRSTALLSQAALETQSTRMGGQKRKTVRLITPFHDIYANPTYYVHHVAECQKRREFWEI